MTEIPEHLLKRSRERRAALGLGGDEGADGGATPSTPAKVESSTPAAAAPAAPAGRAAVPAPAAPTPPKPDSPVVAAYKRRRRVPYWAMVALSIMPVWAILYARAVTAQPAEASGPLGVGAEVYNSAACAGCHGAAGGGGAGYAFTGGAILQTFPHIEDQLRWVYFASEGYNLAGVSIPGDPNREGGPHVVGALGGAMPAYGLDAGGSLPDADILAVVCHERYGLGGADPTGDYSDEFALWCAEDSEIYAALEGGATLATLDDEFDTIIPIGDVPVAGTSAG